MVAITPRFLAFSVPPQRDDPHGHRLQAVDEVRAETDRWPRELEADVAGQDLLEHDPDLEAGQERAEAEVGPTPPERRVGVRASSDVEALRILEHLLVE